MHSLDSIPTHRWHAFFEAARWYGDKGRPLSAVRILDVAHESAGSGAPWHLVELSYADGGPARRYQLAPGLEVSDARPVEQLDGAALLAWLVGIAGDGARATKRGKLLGRSFGAAALDRAAATKSATGVLGGEMSNTLVACDGVVVKLYRRIESGRHPEVEALEHLARSGFAGAPALYATLCHELDADGGVSSALLLVEERLAGATDLWREFTAAGATDLDARAAELGRVTAALHAALADAPVSDAPVRRAAPSELLAVLDAVDGIARAAPDAPLASLARRLAPRRDEIAVRLADAPEIASPIRVHGDFHLGQVVAAGTRLVVLDFEGAPAASLAERLAPAPALSDVADMVRSFSYARQCCEDGPRDASWEDALRRCFLEAYRNASRGAAFVPADESVFDALLAALELRKALAETAYELRHRQEWLHVPLAGLLQILERRAEKR